MTGRKRGRLISLAGIFVITAFSSVDIEAKSFHFAGGCEASNIKKAGDQCVLRLSGFTVTLFPEEKGLKNKPDRIVLYLKLRVSNSGQEPVMFDFPVDSYLQDVAGQIFRHVPADQAIEQLINSTAAFRAALSGAMLGPLAGRNISDSVEKQFRASYGANALRCGQIPTGGFIEGIVFFETFKNDDKRKLQLIVPTWPAILIDYR